MNADFEYPLMDPPFAPKPIPEMSKAEAKQHFDWFIAQSESRRRLLLSAFRANSGANADLDYSAESLVPLWQWVARFFEAVEPSASEKARASAGLPAQLRGITLDMRDLSTETKCLCVDIGFYVAELYMRRYPQVHWLLWTRKSGPFQYPVLSGFKLPLEPTALPSGCAWSVIRGNRSDRLLLEKYQLWEQDLQMAE